MSQCDLSLYFFFFFNDTATTEIYTLSLHDALPIYVRSFAGSGARPCRPERLAPPRSCPPGGRPAGAIVPHASRSEEHTSELQSRLHLVCRLLLEKKKKKLPIRKDIAVSTIKSDVCS